MFERLLSRMGVGAAQVDTILLTPEITRGELLHGEIRLRGGKASQVIERIELELQSYYQQVFEDQSRASYPVVIRRQMIFERIQLAAQEEKNLPFEFLIPLSTPISFGPTQVELRTSLDMPWAIDPKDLDPITIQAEKASARLLSAASALGYVHSNESGICIGIDQAHETALVQAFVFQLEAENPASAIKDFDLMILANGFDAEVQLEVNRQYRAQQANQASHPQWHEDDRPALHRHNFRLRHETDFSALDLQALLAKLTA